MVNICFLGIGKLFGLSFYIIEFDKISRYSERLTIFSKEKVLKKSDHFNDRFF